MADLQYMEELSPEHFVVLSYFADPPGWFEKKGLRKPSLSMGSPRHILDTAQLPVVGDVLEVVLKDLSDRGLANSGSFGVTMTAQGAWQPLTTNRGRLLLNFVQMMDE